jgi:uncharacterized membrane protein YhhN
MAVALALAGVLAVVDWVGVVRDDRRLRWIGKPGVMVALIAAALLAGEAPTAVRTWFVVALVLSLAGDVLLLLPERWFVLGLVAFLLAHVAYIAGLAQLDLHWTWWALAVVIADLLLAPRLLAGVRRIDPALAGPVLAYLLVISAMAMTAWSTGEALLVVAALLFFVSDAVLAWNRFVSPRHWSPLAVMVTYHSAQACFVLWLATR